MSQIRTHTFTIDLRAKLAAFQFSKSQQNSQEPTGIIGKKTHRMQRTKLKHLSQILDFLSGKNKKKKNEKSEIQILKERLKLTQIQVQQKMEEVKSTKSQNLLLNQDITRITGSMNEHQLEIKEMLQKSKFIQQNSKTDNEKMFLLTKQNKLIVQKTQQLQSKVKGLKEQNQSLAQKLKISQKQCKSIQQNYTAKLKQAGQQKQKLISVTSEQEKKIKAYELEKKNKANKLNANIKNIRKQYGTFFEQLKVDKNNLQKLYSLFWTLTAFAFFLRKTTKLVACMLNRQKTLSKRWRELSKSMSRLLQRLLTVQAVVSKALLQRFLKEGRYGSEIESRGINPVVQIKQKLKSVGEKFFKKVRSLDYRQGFTWALVNKKLVIKMNRNRIQRQLFIKN